MKGAICIAKSRAYSWLSNRTSDANKLEAHSVEYKSCTIFGLAWDGL